MALPRIQQLEMSMTDLRRHQPGLALMVRPASRPGQPDKIVWERMWRSTNAEYGSFAGAVPTRPYTKTLPREDLWRASAWDTTARTDLWGARVRAGQTAKPPRRLRDHLSRDDPQSNNAGRHTKAQDTPLPSRPTAPTPARSSEHTISPTVDDLDDDSQRSLSLKSPDIEIRMADGGDDDDTPLSPVNITVSPDMDLSRCSSSKYAPSRASATALSSYQPVNIDDDNHTVDILDCSVSASRTPCATLDLPYTEGKSPWRVPLPRRSMPSDPETLDKQYLLSGRGRIAMEHSLGRFWAPGV